VKLEKDGRGGRMEAGSPLLLLSPSLTSVWNGYSIKALQRMTEMGEGKQTLLVLYG